MSIESDLVATLNAHAPLTALVGGRIAQNAMPAGMPLPMVVFSVAKSYERTLLSEAATQATVSIQCWAEGASQADAVADQVVAAIQAADAGNGPVPVDSAVVTARDSGYDGELGLDATLIEVEWWE